MVAISMFGGGRGRGPSYSTISIHLYKKFTDPGYLAHGIAAQNQIGQGPYTPGVPVHIYRKKSCLRLSMPPVRQWRDTDIPAA